LIALDLQEATLASTTVAKWAADSASKGSVDPAATVTAEAAWKQANDVLKAQERSLKEMVTMLEKQIASHKATNPSDVVLVLEEQIRTLSGIRHVQEKSERETQALLKVLLAEKTQLTGPAAERKP